MGFLDCWVRWRLHRRDPLLLGRRRPRSGGGGGGVFLVVLYIGFCEIVSSGKYAAVCWTLNMFPRRFFTICFLASTKIYFLVEKLCLLISACPNKAISATNYENLELKKYPYLRPAPPAAPAAPHGRLPPRRQRGVLVRAGLVLLCQKRERKVKFLNTFMYVHFPYFLSCVNQRCQMETFGTKSLTLCYSLLLKISPNLIFNIFRAIYALLVCCF